MAYRINEWDQQALAQGAAAKGQGLGWGADGCQHMEVLLEECTKPFLWTLECAEGQGCTQP